MKSHREHVLKKKHLITRNWIIIIINFFKTRYQSSTKLKEQKNIIPKLRGIIFFEKKNNENCVKGKDSHLQSKYK